MYKSACRNHSDESSILENFRVAWHGRLETCFGRQLEDLFEIHAMISGISGPRIYKYRYRNINRRCTRGIKDTKP